MSNAIIMRLNWSEVKASIGQTKADVCPLLVSGKNVSRH